MTFVPPRKPTRTSAMWVCIDLHWASVKLNCKLCISLFVFFLLVAWLQEEVWGHQEQMDLDCGQTWFHPCCEEQLPAEWCSCHSTFYHGFSYREKTICLMNWFVCNSQVEYKYDKEMLKGCVMSISDDKYTILAKQNSELASDVSAIFHILFPFLRINIQNVTS